MLAWHFLLVEILGALGVQVEVSSTGEIQHEAGRYAKTQGHERLAAAANSSFPSGLRRPAKATSAERKLLLQVTNEFRCLHHGGSAPVKWDRVLEQQIVDYITSTNWNFPKGHAPSNLLFGAAENAYGGCKFIEGITGWHSECQACAGGCTGFTDGCPGAGHFVPMIAKSNTLMACGFARDGAGTMCRYKSPSGSGFHRGPVEIPRWTHKVEKCGNPWRFVGQGNPKLLVVDGCCPWLDNKVDNQFLKPGWFCHTGEALGNCWANEPGCSSCTKWLTGRGKGKGKRKGSR